MGIAPNELDRELITRTIKLNTNYKGIFNITLLMNSLLSLIILPHEKRSIRNVQFIKKLIVDVPEIQPLIAKAGFMFDAGGVMRRPNGNKQFIPNPRDFENFLRRIRNGISHQHIEPISDHENKWIAVTIRDFDKQGVCGLAIHFTISELKAFAIFVGNSYLDELPIINKV